jgi:hypothetical protein
MRINNLSREWTFKWTRGLKPRLGLDLNQRGRGQSSDKLEVVIPCLDKDLATLPLVIDSLRAFLKHPLGNIYIVSPVSARDTAIFCRHNDCVFVDETKIAPVEKREIHHRPKGRDRSGWIYQQLIKLNANSLVKTPFFLVWDADTALTKPQAYLHRDKFVINHSDEYHQAYYEIYQRVTHEEARSKVSFITHQMIWSKEILEELKQKLEAENQIEWYRAIIDNLDNNRKSSFSEYELYGNFLNSYHPNSFILEYWFNASLPRNSLGEASKILTDSAADFKSVSWHSYKK